MTNRRSLHIVPADAPRPNVAPGTDVSSGDAPDSTSTALGTPRPMADWEAWFRDMPSAIDTPVVRFEAA